MLRELQPGDPRHIGSYRLVGQLGDGGMGRVFLGRSAGGRPVAVKVIRGELAADPDFRVRFRREVAAARLVSGLFTAVVVDADADAPEPWLATAYVPGPSLAEAVRDHGPLPVDSVLALAAGMAEGLAAIHAAGVVHRDLKPSNVLLGRDGPCVIDFGISRAAEATSMTRAGFVVGSPGFMSPEQAEGDEVGPASDIFSLGAVLAFAASGQPPFGAGSTAALVYRVVHASPRLDGVSDEVRPLIERCLVKDPAQRPTASELLAEAVAAQPRRDWLPEHITADYPDRHAQPTAEAATAGAAAEAEESPDNSTALPAAAFASGAETDSASLVPPLPGGDLTRKKRSGLARPLVLASALAVIVIASIGAAVAVSGSGHRTHTAGEVAATIRAQRNTSAPAKRPAPSPSASARATSRPKPSPSRTAHHSPARASLSPSPQPTVNTTKQAPPTTPAPRPASSKATPKPTPKRTQAPAFSVSVSGASEDSCGAEGAVKSVDGSAVEFTFDDNGSTNLQIAEISTSGGVVSVATLIPGASLTEATNVGAYWAIENAGGGCLVLLHVSGGGSAMIT